MLLIFYSSMKKNIGMIFDIENWLLKSEFCNLQSQIHNGALICQRPFELRKCFHSIWCGSCWKIIKWYLMYSTRLKNVGRIQFCKTLKNTAVVHTYKAGKYYQYIAIKGFFIITLANYSLLAGKNEQLLKKERVILKSWITEMWNQFCHQKILIPCTTLCALLETMEILTNILSKKAASSILLKLIKFAKSLFEFYISTLYNQL